MHLDQLKDRTPDEIEQIWLEVRAPITFAGAARWQTAAALFQCTALPH
jgi:hypothetical protein